ncbi:MAG: murein biosynthesis integral membrane protein MurJ [Fuerstiella sp.]|nr:murein biosynthesis integral membrane protein MurJ [Fuerstiella sp.]
MDGQQKPVNRLKGLKSVSLLTLLSRFTGLARDALMASLFGTGWVLDAFTVAFRVPNLFRRLFGEGAMAAAFLPEFVRVDEERGREAATELFNGVAWRLLKILVIFLLAAEFALLGTWLLVPLSERSALLCELSLILMPYMVLICMAGLYSAALNGVQHFVIPAVSSVVLNLAWLAAGLAAALLFLSDASQMIRLIAICLVFGGMLQLAMTAWKASRYSIRMRTGRTAATSRDHTARVFQAMGPVLIGLSITQINGLIDGLLAWTLVSPNLDGNTFLSRFLLPEGTAAALYLGQRLYQFPLGVFAIALGTVLFPRFARHAASGDLEELSRDLLHGLQLVLVVGIPASVGLWFMAESITNLLFRYGQFGASASHMTAQMIAAYGLGVWAVSGLLIANRVFYAAGDQITPMRQGLICVGLNLIFDFLLLPVLGGPGLPIASILATVFQLGLALEVLRRRFLRIGRSAFVPILWRTVVATLLMSLAGLGVLTLVSQWENLLGVFAYRLVKVIVPIAAAVIVYVAVLSAVGLSPRRLLQEPEWLE